MNTVKHNKDILDISEQELPFLDNKLESNFWINEKDEIIMYRSDKQFINIIVEAYKNDIKYLITIILYSKKNNFNLLRPQKSVEKELLLLNFKNIKILSINKTDDHKCQRKLIDCFIMKDCNYTIKKTTNIYIKENNKYIDFKFEKQAGKFIDYFIIVNKEL